MAENIPNTGDSAMNLPRSSYASGASSSTPPHHTALLAEQEAEARAQDETMNAFIARLKEMLKWEPFLLEHPPTDIELVTSSTISELEFLAYSPHTGETAVPTSSFVLPTSTPHVQSAAVNHLVSDASYHPRTLFIRLKRELCNIDEFISSITPARIESVYWNEAGKYIFMNFHDTAAALAYKQYMAAHPCSPFHWEVRSAQVNGEAREMGLAVAEAVVVNGATRILRCNRVPLGIEYGRVWNLCDTGHPRFCHVMRIREGCVDRDFALEFDDVAKALTARDRLAVSEEMRGVGFVWMTNEMDRKIEGFSEELNGIPVPIRITL